MPPASLMLEVQGPVVYAQVRGEIDMSNATDLRREISTMTPNDTLGLVLDPREVRYMDSAGIHLLYHLREDLGAGGQKMRLVSSADSPANHALRVAGLDWGDETSATVDAACQAVRR